MQKPHEKSIQSTVICPNMSSEKIKCVVTFDKVASKNRKTHYVLWYDGYRFIRKKTTTNKEYWICEIPGCTAKALTQKGELTGILNGLHNHEKNRKKHKVEQCVEMACERNIDSQVEATKQLLDDVKVSLGAAGPSVQPADRFGAQKDKMTPELFVELMSQLYKLGWVLGSSGGMACCSGENVLYSPSSVQKERLKPDDLFVFNSNDSKLVSRPADETIKESACTPVFSLILNQTGAICTIHTHSKYSNLLTQLLRGSNQLEISDQEMIKGIMNRNTGKSYSNFDKLVVPIVENCPQEFQLIPAIKQVLEEYPETCGVLVRNHGFFVWGPTWQRTKIMLECYEYLFELACEMKRHDIPLIKTIVVK